MGNRDASGSGALIIEQRFLIGPALGKRC